MRGGLGLRQVVLRKAKRPGGYGRWPAYEIASDTHGLWFYSPKGTIYRGYPAEGSPIDWEVGRPPEAPEGTSELHLVPTHGWWVANWYEMSGVRHIAVDICVPAQWADGELTFVDLELDPHWKADGSVQLFDQDEFDAAVQAGLIPALEAAEARAASDQILDWLSEGVEPFGSDGWRLFDHCLTSLLQPIRYLADAPTA